MTGNLRAMLLASGACLVAPSVFAAPHQFNISPEPLATALEQLGRQGAIQIVFTPATVGNRQSNGVSGLLEPLDALRQLLAKTGLSFKASGDAYIIVPDPPVAGSQTQADPVAAATTAASATRVASAEPSAGQLEEVVVTAQKRSENLQDVPIAVTALSAAELAAAGVTDSMQLAQVVPGLDFNSQLGGFGQPRIRGVGVAGSGPGIENPVATYIDGVYYAAASSALFAMNDINQVAVLKGPQGTLFGRNATGGLIQVTTRDPSQQFSADLSGTIGTLQTFGGDAYVTGPLSSTLSASADYYVDNQDEGWGVNLANGQYVQTHHTYATRDKLLFQPDEATKITLSGDYEQTHAADWAGRTLDYVTGSANSTPGGNWDIDDAIQPALTAHSYGFSLTAQHDFEYARALSISAYRNGYLSITFDGSDTPVAGPGNTEIQLNEADNQFSEELQLQSVGNGRFSWVTGLYFLRTSSSFVPETTLIGVPFGNINIVEYADEGLKSYAGFGQSTFKIDPLTNVTAGLRYSVDKRSDNANQSSPFGLQTTSAENTFDKLTWRFAVDHHFTDDVLGYVSDNRGFKSGTYDPQTLPADVLKPETLDAYEIGLKSDWLDHRLRLNAAAYYYNYQNVQVTAFVGTLEEVYNGSGATSYGVDLDLQAKPIPELTLDGGLGWIHARYKTFYPTFESVPNGAGVGGDTVSLTGNATGKELQDTPPYTLNLGAVYEIPTVNGKFQLAANYYYNDGWFSEPENRLRQSAYSLVNASVGWSSLAERYSVQAWGKNLGNTIYAAQLDATSSGDNREAAPGRTFGLTAAVHF